MAHLLPLDTKRTCGCRNRRLSLMNMNTKIPVGPAKITPGELLMEEFLSPMGMSIRELARRMGCGPMRVSEIARGKRSITAETSILLGEALGVSPAFWLGVQADHDLAKAAIALKKAA